MLVDAEALLHPPDNNKTRSLVDALAATGFVPNSIRRSSYQYRSSALGRTSPGKHTPYIAAVPLHAARYEAELVNGFRRAWRCLLGTKARRAAFLRRVRRLRGKERRRIYRSTGTYDAIMRASIQPAALCSTTDRDGLIAQLCDRSGVSQIIIREEIKALKRLDVPYFSRRMTAGSPLPESNVAPDGIIEALRHAVRL